MSQDIGAELIEASKYAPRIAQGSVESPDQVRAHGNLSLLILALDTPEEELKQKFILNALATAVRSQPGWNSFIEDEKNSSLMATVTELCHWTSYYNDVLTYSEGLSADQRKAFERKVDPEAIRQGIWQVLTPLLDEVVEKMQTNGISLEGLI